MEDELNVPAPEMTADVNASGARWAWARWGRMQRLPVMHVEAGLCSGDWRNPFPEELDRHLTSRIATIHFAPGATPVSNLKAAESEGARD